MDDGVKQRIVGAFVLLALAVIFIPVFFDRERMEPVDRASQIPLAPEFSATTITDNTEEILPTAENSKERQGLSSSVDTPVSEKVVPAVVSEKVVPTIVSEKVVPTIVSEKVVPTMPPNNSVTAEKMFVPNDSVPESPAPAPSRFDANGVPESWVLQVASFRIDGYAKQMRDELIALGFKAYIRTITTEKGTLTRVYVGPKLDKSRLVTDQKQIEAKYKLKTSLLKFKP